MIRVLSSVPRCLGVSSGMRDTRSHLSCFLILLLCLSTTGRAQSANPLVDAARRGDREAVRALLRTRADVNVPQADGTTALHFAVRANDVDLVKTLLGAGANAKATNRYGIAPITLAATNGSVEILDALLKAGASARTETAEGEPVLLTAARTGNAAAVKLLVGRGADVNARERWFGETAMMWAAAENHADAIRVLAKSGADVNARSTTLDAPVLEFPRSGGPNSPLPRGGWTALMFAAREGAIDAARALADLGAHLNTVALPQTDIPLKADELKTAEQGIRTSALVFAIINSHYDLAAVLIEKGADPNVVDIAGMGALYAAVDMNSLQWVQGRRPRSHRSSRRRGRGRSAARSRRRRERAAEARAAQAPSRRRHHVELRPGHHTPDARRPHQRRRGHAPAAGQGRQSVSHPARSHQRADDCRRSGRRRAARRGYPHCRADAGRRGRGGWPAARSRHGRRRVQQRGQHRAPWRGGQGRRGREIPGVARRVAQPEEQGRLHPARYRDGAGRSRQRRRRRPREHRSRCSSS